ncbi:MAG: ABC transporter permease subunit, partial [Nitrososphaerales archaeon]
MPGTMHTPRAPLPLTIAAIVILAVMALPLVYLSIRTVGVGLDALPLLLSSRTASGLLNTTVLAFLVTSISVLIAVPLAFITVRTDIPGRRFFSVTTALPLVIPSYVGSFVVISALGPRGSIVQNWLAPFGVEQLPSIYGWSGTVMVLSLFTYPYILLIVRSSLRNLDPRIDDASRTLGYGQRQTFFKVTLPHLRPSIAAGG